MQTTSGEPRILVIRYIGLCSGHRGGNFQVGTYVDVLVAAMEVTERRRQAIIHGRVAKSLDKGNITTLSSVYSTSKS